MNSYTLCIQSLFGEATLQLFKTSDRLTLLDHLQWDTTKHKNTNLLSLIDALLQKQNIAPHQIDAIAAVGGPGPFTAARTLAVLLNTWKSQIPRLQLLAIPSGIFLQHQFFGADHLFLSAGKNAFFSFSTEHPSQYKKQPLDEIKNYQGSYGGYFMEENRASNHLSKISPQKTKLVFLQLLEQKTQFETQQFLPIYGSEPSIN